MIQPVNPVKWNQRQLKSLGYADKAIYYGQIGNMKAAERYERKSDKIYDQSYYKSWAFGYLKKKK